MFSLQLWTICTIIVVELIQTLKFMHDADCSHFLTSVIFSLCLSVETHRMWSFVIWWFLINTWGVCLTQFIFSFISQEKILKSTSFQCKKIQRRVICSVVFTVIHDDLGQLTFFPMVTTLQLIHLFGICPKDFCHCSKSSHPVISACVSSVKVYFSVQLENLQTL